MGVKTTARRNMNAAGVPTVPGSRGPDRRRAGGEGLRRRDRLPRDDQGGGRRRREGHEEGGAGGGLPAALWASARRESAGAFGDDRLYLEKFLDRPRHVEIQVFADEHGNVIHLGERECSVQRRQQKVVEESPSCVLDERLRAAMGEVAVRAAKAVGYRGAGTVEFLVDAQRDFYFLEMNTRLQVEHPVTEMVTGLDLVRMQIEVAQGERLAARRSEVRPARPRHRGARSTPRTRRGGSCRRPGKITYLRVPGGPGIRDDSGVYTGWVVPQFYDPLISKLVAWAPTRDQAIERLIRALGEYTVHGITTNVAYLAAVLDHPAFRSGEYDTGVLRAVRA